MRKIGTKKQRTDDCRTIERRTQKYNQKLTWASVKCGVPTYVRDQARTFQSILQLSNRNKGCQETPSFGRGTSMEKLVHEEKNLGALVDAGK